jgi:hypothetical protein
LNGWLHNTVGCWRPFSNLLFFPIASRVFKEK